MVARFFKRRNEKKIRPFPCARFFMQILLFSPFLLVACTPQKMPSLPDLNQPSISYDSTVQEADQLKKQVEQIAEEQDGLRK